MKFSNLEYKRRLQRQLERLASSERHQEQLLTVEQLHYCCCFQVIEVAKQTPQPSAAQLAELIAAAASSAQTMRQLEPSNPKTHIAAVMAPHHCGLTQQGESIMQSFLRVCDHAQQQRGNLWPCLAAANALILATCHPVKVGHSALAAALAAFEETTEAALGRCRRLLPEGGECSHWPL
jgi:hypothetical protein